MKDKQLENAFGEYFDGVEKAPSSITADAKKQLNLQRKRNRVLTRAAAVAASVIAVCAGAGLIISYSAANSYPPSSDAQIEYYELSALSPEVADCYSASSFNPALSFIERLAHGRNSAVNSCTAYYDGDGGLALLKAEVFYTEGLYRHDATVYAEFTDEFSVCDIFKDFEKSVNIGYGYLSYKFYSSEDDGEYVGNAATRAGGVKFYFSVKSSNEQAYLTYLNMLPKQ